MRALLGIPPTVCNFSKTVAYVHLKAWIKAKSELLELIIHILDGPQASH